VIKSGLILTIFNVIAAMLGLVRNIMIARLLSVEDFGIASTFALTMALVDMSANIGIDRLIVQSKDGEAEGFQSTLQSFQVMRGLFGGVVLFLLAYPLTQLFKTPDALWAYQLMAIIPVLRGFVNLDLNRFQRVRKFWPSIATETSAQVVATVMALSLAWWGSDYRAMLYALIGQQVASTVLSQLLAERRFRFSWDADIVKQAVNFGWPLLLNGALMFGAFHGDRVIVGNQMGPAVLGWFSVAYMLTLIPSTLLLRVLQTLCLPVLAQHQDDDDRFKTLALVATEAGCFIGVLLVLGNALVGGLLIHILFGAKHDQAIAVLVPLAAVQALRLAKAGPSVIAIAKRQTTNPMWANLLRVAFLPIAYGVALNGGDPSAVVWIAALGELAGLVLSYALLVKKSGLQVITLTRIFIAFCLCIAAPLLYDHLYPGEAGAIAHIAGLLLVVVTVIYALTLTHVIAWLRNRLRASGFG
jgi:O-antigen/teichoic acid export membrane protein